MQLRSGNPFFVTEMLTHGVGDVPRNVQDLVLARFARLSSGRTSDRQARFDRSGTRSSDGSSTKMLGTGCRGSSRNA